MAMFGYFITRPLTPDELAELRAKVEAIGAELPPSSSPPIAPTIPLPGGVQAGPNGWRSIGDVEILWLNGRPMTAHLAYQPEDAAEVPAGLWDAIRAWFQPPQRVPMLAIAFHESRFALTVRATTPDEDSYGAWQINMRAHPEYSPENLNGYDAQAGAAANVWAGEGYGAWWIASGLLGLR